jgi:hypothetical protein
MTTTKDLNDSLRNAIFSLQHYEEEMQTQHDELEEKQGEKESEARQQKIDDLVNRIEIVQAAIEALEAVE